jgi:hypothetical protein
MFTFTLSKLRRILQDSLPQACPEARVLLASRLVNSIPPEAAPYVLGTSLMGVLFIAGMVRIWLLRRVEEKLLKNKEALEKQIITQQKDLMQVRSDANAWRSEMQRQFDQFRHMACDQLKVEETRYDNLMSKSREREQDLQTKLDIARQMCAELPSAKARVMQLESALGIDAGEGLSISPTAAVNGTHHLTMMPDLNGSTDECLPVPAPSESAELLVDDIMGEPAAELVTLRQQNALLQQALTAERLRSRQRERSNSTAKSRARRSA